MEEERGDKTSSLRGKTYKWKRATLCRVKKLCQLITHAVQLGMLWVRFLVDWVRMHLLSCNTQSLIILLHHLNRHWRC